MKKSASFMLLSLSLTKTTTSSLLLLWFDLLLLCTLITNDNSVYVTAQVVTREGSFDAVDPCGVDTVTAFLSCDYKFEFDLYNGIIDLNCLNSSPRKSPILAQSHQWNLRDLLRSEKPWKTLRNAHFARKESIPSICMLT